MAEVEHFIVWVLLYDLCQAGGHTSSRIKCRTGSAYRASNEQLQIQWMIKQRPTNKEKKGLDTSFIKDMLNKMDTVSPISIPIKTFHYVVLVYITHAIDLQLDSPHFSRDYGVVQLAFLELLLELMYLTF